MLYVTPVAFSQTLVEPVMAPAALGEVDKVTAVELLVPLPQALVGVTSTLPEVVPKLTVIVLVEVPLVIDAPVGTVHVYPVAPLTASIL